MVAKPEPFTLPNGAAADWQPRRLGELCFPQKDLEQPSDRGLNRYAGLEHLDPGFAKLRRWSSDAGLRSTKARFQAGDVLYGKLRPYLDKAALAEFEGVCSTDILVLRSKTDELEPAFLSFLLHSPPFLAHAIATTRGVNHPRTDWSSIAAFEQAIPKPPEQRAIAGVLSKLQAAVEIQDRIVATLKELRAATMAKVFREGLRGEPLKETEFGEIPESWDVVRLGDHCKLASGGTPARGTPEYWNGSIPWVKTGEINYRPILKTEEWITEPGLRNSSARVLPAGTLLMAMYGQGVTRGRIAFLGIDAATNQACAAFFPDESLDSKYLYAFCSYAYDRIREAGHGANQKNLSAEIIAGLRIPMPPTRQEQTAIGDIVETLNDSCFLAEKRRERYEGLFSSALSLLVSGKIRVHSAPR